MNEQIKPIRSVLYIPGSNPRALEKGRDLACDAIIMDIEDAVAPNSKDVARDNISRAITKGGYAKRLLAVRINGFATQWWADDLEMALASGAHAVVLPKVDDAAIIQHVAEKIDDEKEIWAMIETPSGVLNAREIASSHEKLACLVMGTSDLARELQCAHTPDRLAFMTSFGLCILAARSNGLSILDGVHLDLSDDEGFAKVCKQGLEMGFDGKTLIHPKTIETANFVFTPTVEQLEEARGIIDAHDQAKRNGIGVVVLNGKLIENLHVEMAKQLLALHKAIQAHS